MIDRVDFSGAYATVIESELFFWAIYSFPFWELNLDVVRILCIVAFSNRIQSRNNQKSEFLAKINKTDTSLKNNFYSCLTSFQ